MLPLLFFIRHLEHFIFHRDEHGHDHDDNRIDNKIMLIYLRNSIHIAQSKIGLEEHVAHVHSQVKENAS